MKTVQPLLCLLIIFVALITFIFVIPAITWPENIMDDPDFEKMGKPKVEEGLFHFHEGGQSFEEYVSSHPIRTTASRRVLVFQPVGQFSPYEKDILRKATEFAGIWFDVPTRIEPVLPFPAWCGRGTQR